MSEWMDLILQAKKQGISKDELLIWFETVKIRATNTDQ